MSEPNAEAKPSPGAPQGARNPFIGAESFRTGDKIFGRDREIEEFATRLLARRVVLLNSPSGAGKTSLVQAGVIPALNRKGVHILPKVRLNNQLPDDALPQELKGYNRYLASLLLSLDAGEGIPDDAHLSYTQIAELSLKSTGVLEYLATHTPYARGTRPRRRLVATKRIQRSLIFFDQFEEVLTLDSTDADAKKDFFVRISALLNDYSTIAIFAMREEYVAGLEPYLVYIPERLSARFRLELLGKDGALDAISKPVRRVGVRFERQGAELLVERLSQVTVREGNQEVKKSGQFIEPVQLQVVCRDLFERREKPEQISLRDVEQKSSIEDALGDYYDKKVNEVALAVLGDELVGAAAQLEQAVAALREADPDFLSTATPLLSISFQDLTSAWQQNVQRLRQERTTRQEASQPSQEGGDIEELRAFYNALLELKKPEKALDIERKLRDWIEQELIVAGRLRGQAIAGEESKFGLEKSAIDKLIKAFIVREEPRRGLVWYELAHDSLVRPVVASNQVWRELHASEFEIQAARWSKAPESERERLLPAGEALRQAVAWGEAHLESLSEAQKDYLSAARREVGRMDVRQDNRAELGINLEDTGWGVIFAAAAPGALREALKELLDLRRSQAGRKRSTYYREFFGADGYRPGETAQRFLARWDASSGLANPEKMPYYLLIVGDPAEIPFEFQYGLDIQYAVGRIYFETLEEYARYARSVVLSETRHAEGSFNLPNRLAFFAVQNPGDRATKLNLDYIAAPLIKALPEAAPNWDVQSFVAEQATKAKLEQLLGGAQTPALLFTSSHGIQFNPDNPDQPSLQGALVCQAGQGQSQAIFPAPDVWYSAADVPEEGNLLGTIVVSIGEFTAGTPRMTTFPAYRKGYEQKAEQPFLARLPQRLLSHSQGGALAMLAHVDDGWANVLSDAEAQFQREWTSDTGPFQKLMVRLMQGSTLGMAMEDLNRRYFTFWSALADELVSINLGQQPRDEAKLSIMMLLTFDARNYIIIGDPAVRLPVRADQPYQEPPAGWQRPTIEAVSAKPPAEAQPAEEVAAVQPELLVEIAAPPTAEPAPEAAAGEVPGVSVDSLASALLKGQKLKLSDYK